jgi:flagellar biosynthesis/type III secretory pathway M-ring protein FliF/YscJ
VLAEIHPRLPTLIERTALWVGRRRAGVAGAIATGAALAAIALGIGRFQGDVPLFDEALRPSQTSDVESALTLWGETFRADAQGTEIFVSASRRRDLLLRLTLAGLPRRYVPTSADVLDDRSNALTPQSIIDDRRRSGIEGDIVAGLRRIAGIADAAVVLPPAQADPLGDPDRTEPPSAAVQLIMQPGETLSAEAVAGVRRFVASAYPGLSPDRVAVIDASGAAIGSPPSPDAAMTKERRVQGSVQSALDAIFGAGVAVVRVSVSAAGSEQQSQSTKVVPHGALSADVAHERGTEAGKSFDRERTTRRYAYDTLSERRVTTADAPVRMAVAVFLNASRVASTSVSDVSALVRAAAGADLAAGDEVVVQTLDFASPAPQSPPSPADVPDVRAGIARAAVACALALFGFATLPLSRARGFALEKAALAKTPVTFSSIDPHAERSRSILASLAGESPQAAAYVLAFEPHDVREGVLRRCAAERRDAIVAYLDLRSSTEVVGK